MSNPALGVLNGLSVVIAALAVTACGGGGGASNDAAAGNQAGSPNPPPASSSTATRGVWTGTISSSKTGQSSGVVGLVAPDGFGMWMTTDGRVLNGQMPLSGDRFEIQTMAHMYDGDHFPDGTNHGDTAMMFDTHTASSMMGRFSGAGDSGTFSTSLSPMWDRPASLAEAAGVYTRSVSTGYTMTMTISANGQLSATDTRGCVIYGTVSMPDPIHNLYRLDATATSCGTLDGSYRGMGSLLDADTMRDWMSGMRPLEHGGHMMGASHMMGHNTVPGGQRNLFMFSLVNDRNAIMDALAR